MRIKVIETTYRGRPVISLYDIDASKEYKDYPVITLGVRKAKAVISAATKIKKFIKKREG